MREMRCWRGRRGIRRGGRTVRSIPPARGNPLRISSRAVAQERNDAAKQRDEPKTEYGHAQKGIKHLVPDFLVGRPLIGQEGKKGWDEQPPEPQEPGVSSQNRCLIIIHSRPRRSRSHPNLLRKDRMASTVKKNSSSQCQGPVFDHRSYGDHDH